MDVVFIGHDCSGKSTIAKALQAEYQHVPLTGYRRTDLPEDPWAFTEQIWEDAHLPEMANLLTLRDQWPFPVDIVYSQAMLDKPSALKEHEEALTQSYVRKGTLFVLVETSEEVLEERFAARGDELWNLEQIKKVRKAWQEWASCYNHPNLVRLDGSKPPEENVKFLQDAILLHRKKRDAADAWGTELAAAGKAVVMFSGGMDSTAILLAAKSICTDVMALSFRYGQTHSVELDVAKEIANSLDIKHHIVDLTDLFAGSREVSLLGKGEIPKGEYSSEDIPSTYVPNRNNLFLNVATTVGMMNGFNSVIYGIHGDDTIGAAYPDCTPEFAEAANRAVNIGTGGEMQIIAPFVQASKATLAAVGVAIHPQILAMSYSCYAGGEVHCGSCSTCLDRKKAFKVAGLEDMTTYAQ